MYYFSLSADYFRAHRKTRWEGLPKVCKESCGDGQTKIIHTQLYSPSKAATIKKKNKEKEAKLNIAR